MTNRYPLVTARGERIVFAYGLRTPFVRQATLFDGMTAIDLGQTLVTELLSRYEINPAVIDLLVFGQVIQMPQAPNIARELVLTSGLPVTTDAFTVSRACATSFQSVASVAERMVAGGSRIAIAGGADSSSMIPFTLSRKLASWLLHFNKSRTWQKKMSLLGKLRPSDFRPNPPAVREHTTNLRMGDTAEQMAKRYQITRQQQDYFAWHSHQKAAKSWAAGELREQVMATFSPVTNQLVVKDNTLRLAATLDDYAALKPAFDTRYGSVTAGTSTQLTDGAAAVVMMTESAASEQGITPLGYLRGYAFSASHVKQDMLLGPLYAVPKALASAGITMKDLQWFEMHEAFAAQVLSNALLFSNPELSRHYTEINETAGEIDQAIFNCQGGALAYGHPFAATGCRMITQALHGLKKKGGGLGIVSACAAGGLGAAMVLEVDA